MRFLPTLLLGLLLPGISSQAANQHTPLKKTGELKNGLKIIMIEDHQSPSVLVSLWYGVGSSYEVNGHTGISHMLEHMMFEGTQHYNAKDYRTLVSSMGGRQNAATSQDYTVYYQIIPKTVLDKDLKLEADRMSHLNMQAKNFQNEKQAVKEERHMRIEDNPTYLAYMKLNAIAYKNNPNRHPIIGWQSDIDQYNIKDTQQWYKKWYAPNNAILVVMGDFKPKSLMKTVNRYFGSIPKKNLPSLKNHHELPFDAQRVLDVKTAQTKTPKLIMAYNTPTLSTLPPNDQWKSYALLIISGLLDANDYSRLPKNLVRDKPIASEIKTYYSLYGLHPGLFTIWATPQPTIRLNALEQAIDQVLMRLKKEPVSEKELKRVRIAIQAMLIYQQDDIDDRNSAIGIPLITGLSLKDTSNEEIIKYIDAITPQQIQWVAQHYFKKNNQTVANIKPKTKETIAP